MKIFDRISKLINNEGVSVRSFEANIGCSNGTIAKCLSKGTDVSSIWISKIVEKYPQYNAEWLLTGEGEMLKGEKPHSPHAADLMGLIQSQQRTIENLSGTIENQSETIRKLLENR